MGNFRETKNSAIANAARPLSWTMIARRILTIAKHSSLQRPRANSAGGHPFRLFDYGARFSAASDFDISVRANQGMRTRLPTAGLRSAIAIAIAATCVGFVPQQPPINRAPSAAISRADCAK